MAKSKKVEETRTSIDEINDSLTSMSEKVQKNQKSILIVSLIVAVVIALVCIYIFCFRNPGIKEANAAIGSADIELLVNGNDSLALVQYTKVAENYGGDAANRARLMSAIQLYQDGEYEKALNYIKDYSASDDVIGAAAYSLEGDCYVNLEKYQDAVGAYKKAISQSDDNPYYTPFFMLKLARVYNVLGDYAAEASTYKDIIKKYPTYNGGVNLEKYYEAAQIRAGK